MSVRGLQGMVEEPAPAKRKTWSDEMVETLKQEYPRAREEGQLRQLAERLGVELYDVYNKAHRLGLSRVIRRR